MATCWGHGAELLRLLVRCMVGAAWIVMCGIIRAPRCMPGAFSHAAGRAVFHRFTFGPRREQLAVPEDCPSPWLELLSTARTHIL